MLRILEKHHTFGELFQKSDNSSASNQFSGPVLAAAYSRRSGSLAIAINDGQVFFIDKEKERVCIREDGDIISDIAFDWNGRLIYVNAAKASIERSYHKGEELHTVVKAFQGRRFQNIGAISIHSNGMIYFSDNCKTEPPAIYFANPIGLTASCAGTDVVSPAAVCCSADNRFLYIAESEQGMITKFNILDDGTLKYKRIHCFLAQEDVSEIHRMLVDEKDNLFVVTDAGIHVFSVGGMLLGVIETAKRCTAACFGGKDLKTLYIFCGEQLYIMKLK